MEIMINNDQEDSYIWDQELQQVVGILTFSTWIEMIIYQYIIITYEVQEKLPIMSLKALLELCQIPNC